MTIVVSRPIDKYESKPATSITHDWAQDVIDSMLCGGLNVYDLSGTFNREQVEYALSDPNVDMFVHYGHGINDCLLGSNNECILDDFNVELLENKIVVSINCDSADGFGIEAIEAGATAYIGYEEKVYIKYNQQRLPYIGFKKSNNAWSTLMAKGNITSVGQAFNEMIKLYQDWKMVYYSWESIPLAYGALFGSNLVSAVSWHEVSRKGKFNEFAVACGLVLAAATSVLVLIALGWIAVTANIYAAIVGVVTTLGVGVGAVAA